MKVELEMNFHYLYSINRVIIITIMRNYVHKKGDIIFMQYDEQLAYIKSNIYRDVKLLI